MIAKTWSTFHVLNLFRILHCGVAICHTNTYWRSVQSLRFHFNIVATIKMLHKWIHTSHNDVVVIWSRDWTILRFPNNIIALIVHGITPSVSYYVIQCLWQSQCKYGTKHHTSILSLGWYVAAWALHLASTRCYLPVAIWQCRHVLESLTIGTLMTVLSWSRRPSMDSNWQWCWPERQFSWFIIAVPTLRTT